MDATGNKHVTPRQRLCEAMNQILQHPETWNQSSWHCESSHCLLGWVEALLLRDSNLKPEDKVVFYNDVIAAAGLSTHDGDWVVKENRTLKEIYLLCREHLAGRPTTQNLPAELVGDSWRTPLLTPEFAAVLRDTNVPEGGWPLLDLKDFPLPCDTAPTE